MFLKLSDHLPMRITEWLVSGILLSWGTICLGADPQLWDLPINASLAHLETQTFWGAFALALAFMRMTALFINGAVRRSPHARAIGAFLSGFLWLQLSFGLALGPLPSLSAIIYPWLFIADVYNVFRASQDARQSDERAKVSPGAVRDAASA